MLENQKKCTKCFIIKDLSEFYTDNGKIDKKKNECKECSKKANLKYRNDNKEKLQKYRNEYNHKYYKENKEKFAKYKKDHEERDKKKRRERDATPEGRERTRANDRRRREKSPEYQKQRCRESYRRNAEKRRASKREYRRKNPEKVRLAVTNCRHKRRLQKLKASDSTIPLASYPLTKQLQELLQSQRYKCNNCGCDISEHHHLDHHIPLSKGGSHSIDNVVFLCPTCNLKKSASIPSSLMLVY